MQGIELTTPKLEDWETIFKCWLIEMERVIQLCNGHDAPYVHAEHGGTHHFGVCASKTGKGTIRELVGLRDNHEARLDLCMVSEETLDIVEAKWLGISYPSNKDYTGEISRKLNEACKDARSYKNKHQLFQPNNKIHRRTGILFITPCFDNVTEANMMEVINDLLSKLSNVQHDIHAWSFPDNARNLKYWQRTYPGTIAIARCNEN